MLEGRVRGCIRGLQGAQKNKDGVVNLVMKDEGDPLGTYPSVVQVLRNRGLGVEEDIRLSMWSSIESVRSSGGQL